MKIKTTLYDLWKENPGIHVFVEQHNNPGVITEYHGQRFGGNFAVDLIRVVSGNKVVVTLRY